MLKLCSSNTLRIVAYPINQSIKQSIKQSTRFYHPTASAFRGRGVGSPFVAPNSQTFKGSSNSPSINPIKVFETQATLLSEALTTQTAHPEKRALLVNDLGSLARQHERWCVNLPNIKPFYAVKCNPDVQLIDQLHRHGSGFDVASAAEMETVLKLGAKPDDIIFANPIKSVTDLRYAAKVGVRKMTFDNVDELYKIKEHMPNALCVLRLLPDDSGSVMRFGAKFGAPLVHVQPLLQLARDLDLTVIGTSFHIGSGCFDTQSYAKAIALCRGVFDLARDLGMPRFTLLDLGGGWPGNPKVDEDTDGVPAFEKFAAVTRASLAEHFPGDTHGDVTVIAEPGRFMATAFATLFVHVQGKREQPVEQGSKRKFLYYVNDGVYGSFNCIMFDHAKPAPKLATKLINDKLAEDGLLQYAERLSSVQPPQLMGARGLHSSATRDMSLATHFGPTCDSMDVIVTDYPMEELFVGDWLAFENMGAYTNAAATTFNGMPLPNVIYGHSNKA